MSPVPSLLPIPDCPLQPDHRTLGPLKSLRPDPQVLVQALLPWFGGHARDLPWRRSRDPYAIWVSEIMLQQTQVQTVIPYWERWMQALPDLPALARAPEERVLKLWEGLGYYSRARNLQRAARLLVDRGTPVPDTVDALMALPGIGRYTAGAIASIAFLQPAPILDGNVIRVLTRLYALGGDPRASRLNAQLWNLATQLVQAAASTRAPNACSALNQGLMELGALICTPRNPECGQCPWRRQCKGRAEGRVHRLPGGRRPAPPVHLRRVVVVAEHGGRRWVRQRPPESVNGGFWEFPECELPAGSDAVRVAADWLGNASAQFEPLGQVRHAITRHRILLEVLHLRGKPRRAPGQATRWVSTSQLAALPLTGAHRRIVRRWPGPPAPAS